MKNWHRSPLENQPVEEMSEKEENIKGKKEVKVNEYRKWWMGMKFLELEVKLEVRVRVGIELKAETYELDYS